MLREKISIFTKIMFFADILAVLVSYFLGYILGEGALAVRPVTGHIISLLFSNLLRNPFQIIMG